MKSRLKVHEVIRLACLARLKLMQPYIHTWPEAVKVLAHPTNILQSSTNLFHLVDEIWYLAGDKSLDVCINDPTKFLTRYL